MILPRVRDPRFVVERRGGSLRDDAHRALGLWATACAERVLPLFENTVPGDQRPREALETIRAWAEGRVKVTPCKVAAYHANEAARGLPEEARWAAYAAGQAAAVAHVADHALGAAAYALRASPDRRSELDWHRDQLPAPVRPLILQTMEERNDLCWGVFSVVW